MDGRQFEDEVRRIARELWPSAAYDGASSLGGQERDGIFETDYVVHVIECTMLPTKDKAQKDIDKIRDAMKRVRGLNKGVQGWFITYKEPTDVQRGLVARSDGIRVLSFAQFQRELVDARAYLSMRDKYAFGSARDPSDGRYEAPDKYIPLQITLQSASHAQYNPEQLARRVDEDTCVLLVGDYGAGKSMTMREVYRLLAAKSRQSSTNRLPIHVNLRDHQGQSDPVEVLERHARKLGFPRPDTLVRAWRAGYAHLLLDGFDEIATMSWSGPTKAIRAIRFKSVEVVRQFVQESPRGTGILIAGRQHFFDSDDEMLDALVGPFEAEVARIDEFDEDQIAAFLQELSWKSPIPSWIPGKPLLLSYLVSRDMLREVVELGEGSAPAVAWDHMLDAICQREAQIEAGLVAANVRRIIERLATFARRTATGIGPVFFDDVERAFKEVVGFPPDDTARVLLQRLPGLGAPDPLDQSRRFVDEQLVDTARAGDIVDIVRDPFAERHPSDHDWAQLLGQHGVEVAGSKIGQEELLKKNLPIAVRHWGKSWGEHGPVLADLLRVVVERGQVIPSDRDFYVSDLVIPSLVWEGAAELPSVYFRDCIVEVLDLPRERGGDALLPAFQGCTFVVVDGRMSVDDLPSDKFVDCKVESFVESSSTTGNILASSLPLGVRVTLTVLKKLYRQRGSGRKASALVRGLDPSIRVLVPRALELLKQQGLALELRIGGETVWQPVRGQQGRISRMLDAPTSSVDAVISLASEWQL